MGAFRGALSVSKFFVRGKLADDHRRKFVQRIKLRTFRPLVPEEDVEERFGWCAAGDATELELGADKVFDNAYVTLGLRIDRWRFPAAVLNGQLREAVQAELERSGQEKLSRDQMAALKSRVLVRLKKKYFPSIKLVDVVWDLNRMEAYVWSHSPRIHECFQALFEVTFDHELTAQSPYTEALERVPGKVTESALSKVQLSLLHSEARSGPG